MRKEKEILELLKNNITPTKIQSSLDVDYYKLCIYLDELVKSGVATMTPKGKKFRYYKLKWGENNGRDTN